MKIVPPTVIDDTVLTYSNVVETAAAYNAGTGYAIGDAVSIVNGGQLDIYTSLANVNLGHAPASSPTWWTLSSSTYPAYSGATTYADGARVIDPTTHHAFEGIGASNLGNALTDTTKWLDLGATNRWLMFDNSNTSQTVRQDSIIVHMTPAGVVDTVAVFNCDAADLRIVVTDPVEGVKHDQTYPMTNDAGIDNWFDYLNTPIDRITDKVVTGLPLYAGATIAVTLSNAGQEVRCGACFIGLARNIGGTQWEPEVGIQDYSRKVTDDFGNASFVPRAYARRASPNVLVQAAMVDTVVNLLATYRATPVLWLGDEAYASLAILGICKDFRMVIALPDMSYLSLNLEGLT